MTDTDSRLFAPGGKRDLLIGLGVASILAWAIFGWKGVAVVLSVPLLAVVGAALTFAYIALVMRSVVTNVGDELPEADEDE